MLEELNKVIGPGRVVEVSEGYAHNFLVPNRMAVPLGCKHYSEKSEEGSNAAGPAARLPSFLLLRRPTSNGIRLYSPIRAKDIVLLLKKFKAYLWKSQIISDRPIDKVGHYKIKVCKTKNMVNRINLIVRET